MSEWEQRTLCPDGGCVGVIGPDGTCKVCGRAAPNWGEERKRGLIETAAADEADEAEDDDDEYEDDDGDGEYEDDEEYEDDDEDDENDGEPGAISASASGDPDWGGRKLCPDGACVGVIGDNGTCKVCGKSAA